MEKTTDKCTNKFEEENIESLTRQNHITCSRYYKHRMETMQALILNNFNFIDIEDYLFSPEFQIGGNEHDHAFLWTENAPIYRQSFDKQLTRFVDKYMSFDSLLLTPKLDKFQTHHHTKSCEK